MKPTHDPGNIQSSGTRSLPSSSLDIKQTIWTTITDVGAFGYALPGGSTSGWGFSLSGSNALFHAGLVVGTSRQQVSDAAWGSDDNGLSTPYDFSVMKPLWTEWSGGVSRARYDDSVADSPLGLEIRQTAWTLPDQSFIVVDFEILATAPQANLRVGLFADWDIGYSDFDENAVGTASDSVLGREFVYMRDVVALPQDDSYYGTIALSHAGANLRAVHNPSTIYPRTVIWPDSKLYWVDSAIGDISNLNLNSNTITTLASATNTVAIALDLRNSKIYSTNQSAGEIQRRNLDGSGLETVLVTAGAGAIDVDPLGGKVYWAVISLGELRRANLDGSAEETILTIGTSCEGLALDTSAGKIYWTEYSTGNIRRANLDGTTVETQLTGVGGVTGIAIDSGNGKMYWCEETSGKVRRANTDGSGLEDLHSADPFDGVFSIDLDLTAGKVYWTNYTDDTLNRANLNGTAVETLPIFGSPFTLAVESHAQPPLDKLLWCDAQANTIWSSNLDGSSTKAVLTGLGAPTDLEVDISSGKMYWVELTGTDRILGANLDGTAVEELVTVAGSLQGICLDRSSGKIYWADPSAQRIARANLDGSGIETVVSGLNGVRDIAVDEAEGKIYWSMWIDDQIHRANLDGSGVEVLIASAHGPHGIALDPVERKIYWCATDIDRIRRSNMDGSGAQTVALTTGFPRWLTLDLQARKAYWSDLGADLIQRVDMDGGTAENVVTGTPFPHGVGVLQGDPGFEDRDKYALMEIAAPSVGTRPADWSSLNSVGPFNLAAGESLRVAFALAGASDESMLRHQMSTALVAWQKMYFEPGALFWTELDDLKVGDLAGNQTSSTPYVASLGAVKVDRLGSAVYVADTGGRISRQALGDPNSVTLVNNPSINPMGLDLDVSDNRMYWIDSYTGDIWRAFLNGSNPLVLLRVNGADASLAVDPVGRKLYVAESQSLWCYPLDGGPFDIVTSPAFDNVGGIALEPVAGKIYWSQDGDPAVLRANLDLTNPEAVVSGINNIMARDIALDAATNNIYWADMGAGIIYRANLDGSNAASVMSNLDFPVGVALGPAGPVVTPVLEWPNAPVRFALRPNVPNPFNPSTTIHFELAEPGFVRLAIYDVRGRLVRTLVERTIDSPGDHLAVWNGRDNRGVLSESGVYYYMLEAGDYHGARKMLLLK